VVGSDFFKIGYYVNNELVDPDDVGKKLIPSAIKRNVLQSDPKISKFEIDW
jgi:hypothetical protein